MVNKNRQRKSKSLYWLAIVAILGLLGFFGRNLINSTSPQKPIINSSTSLTVHVIDVGQGDSILIQFPTGQSMLVDAGDNEHGGTVVGYLQHLGIQQLDLLVATHPHEDHIGGMADVLGAFPVEKVWDSGYNLGSRTQETFLRTIRDKRIRYETPRAGDAVKFGATTVTVLAPVDRLLHGTESDANNNSLVLRLTYGTTSFLLAGDMEGDERQTVQSWPPSTVLKVAHHGSHNGTDARFIDEVRPDLAVISCGRNNPFGHPHAETLAILRDAGVRIKNTAVDGTVVLHDDGHTVSLHSEGGAVTRFAEKKEPPSAAATTPPSPPAGSSHEAYIGNVRSHAFHRSTCASLPAEHNRVYFTSRDDAIRQGYHPCGRCNP